MKNSLSALLVLSLLLLASCGSRQISTPGDTTADVRPQQTEATEQTEQTEAMEQTKQTEATEQTEQTEPPEPVEPTESAGVSDYLTADALRRSKHAWLRYNSEPVRDEDGAEEISTDGGEEMQKAKATLYIGDGYSIYILDDEWAYQAGTMGGRHADIWKTSLSENENTELRIIKLGDYDISEAQAWVREQYPDYRLYEDKRRGLGGADLPYPKATLGFDASFCFLGEDLYAVISIQPFKYYDRFMYPLKAMMDTIRPFFYFPTAEELGRPEHMQLSYRAEGEEIVSEASLYVGSSYSIYLPDEVWTSQTDILEADTVGAWKSTLHDGVELRIDRREHWRPEEEVVAGMFNPEYTIIEKGEHGEVIGENVKGWRMEVSFEPYKLTSGEYGTYYVIYKVYPPADTEESERIKAMLDAMTDTFNPFENAVKYSSSKLFQ